MQKKKQPIGVFDSGIGGLTVLEKLIQTFPNENFLYVADQGHCPYGTKSQQEVGDRVEKVARYLVEHGAKAIVIACNTASLQIARARAITDVPVISVIQPTCAKAVSLTKNKKVAVLATVGTIRSGKYQQLLQEAGVTPVPLACSEFVDFVESHDVDDPAGEALVAGKLAEIRNEGFDTLIHGCTHFSLLEPQMRKVLGDIRYVDCGTPTSEYLANYLKEHALETASTEKGKVQIFTTGSVENANATMKWFRAEHAPVAHVEIE